MSDLAFAHVFEKGSSPVTLLLLHGTGGDERDLIPLSQALDPTVSILSPRGRVNENGALRFFRRIKEGVFDQEDLRLQTDDLAQFVKDAAANYGFSQDRLLALGYSNGANMAASLLLRHPSAMAGGILLRGMVPFEPEGAVDLKGKRVLLASGIRDTMIPLASAVRLAEILMGGGALVEHLRIPTGHELTRADLETAKSWLAQADQDLDAELDS